jgi:hypothetical protein
LEGVVELLGFFGGVEEGRETQGLFRAEVCAGYTMWAAPCFHLQLLEEVVRLEYTFVFISRQNVAIPRDAF